MRIKSLALLAISIVILYAGSCFGRTLDQIREEGVLRHLGVPYANFVTGQGDGLSVELVKRFAEYLGVRYEFVKSSWPDILSDLTGEKPTLDSEDSSRAEKRGDLIANGLTILPWRQQIIDFSYPTFPTQVWLVTTADFPLKPISPENEEVDIKQTRELLKNIRLLGKKNTCLDPMLYPFAQDDFTKVYFDGVLNDLFPAIIKGRADCTLLDVPDALVAMGRWPGQVKILGPLSEQQHMGVGFRKEDTELRQAFNEFYAELHRKQIYRQMVNKYYPEVLNCFPDFFTSDL